MNIGLWGCGTMGANLASALADVDGATLAVVYDADASTASPVADRHGAVVARSSEQLLAEGGIDAVMIALPSYMHAPATIEAAEAGVHVFVEKPMSIDAASCRNMIDAAARNEVRLMVGQVLRYYEPYRSLLRAVGDGRFGDLHAASIWRTSKGLKPGAAGWRIDPERSGGIVFEVGVHELDMLRCLCGVPSSVRALSAGQVGSGADGDYRFLTVQVEFASGAVGTYETGVGGHAAMYGFRLYFDRATVVTQAAFDRSKLEIHGLDGPVDISSLEMDEEPPVAAELAGWLDAIASERNPPIPGEEGLATVALAEAVRRSADYGGVSVEYAI